MNVESRPRTRAASSNQLFRRVYLSAPKATESKRPFKHRRVSSFSLGDASSATKTSLQWRKIPRLNIHTPIVRDTLVDSPNRRRLKAAKAVNNIAYGRLDKALSVRTYYDALPYLGGRAKYLVLGPLQLVFNHFAALDNRVRRHESRRASRSFHEIQYGTTTLSAQELLYFCSRFKMLGKRLLKWKEVQMVYQHSCGYAEKLRRSGFHIGKASKTQLPGLVKSQYQSCSSQLSVHEFIVVLARFSKILFPRLALTWKWRHLEHKENVSDIDEWNLFVDVFQLADMKYIKNVLRKSTVSKNARISSISFTYHGSRQSVFNPRFGARQSLGLLRMGFAREIAERMGRNPVDAHHKPFEPLSIELLNTAKERLYKAPSRDWRRYQAEFINFGELMKERLQFDGLVEITNIGKENQAKWLTASLCEDAPRFVSLRGKLRVHLYYGIKWRVLVHVNMKDATRVDKEIGFTFYVLLHQGKRKRLRQLVARIPVFLKIKGDEAPGRSKMTMPCLKAVDLVNRIRFEFKNEPKLGSRSNHLS